MTELERIQASRSSVCLKMRLRRRAAGPKFHLVVSDVWIEGLGI